ncbi:PadR family transcriptional regulator [Paenibacillus sp. GSMTC-2017]|nr:PadR family transcriptional regulator [Paenibacillus sp. GSMTC-2017]
MYINFAILGILSSQSLTGYDLKKIIQESPFMYWSGNNNQIYKALGELLEADFVTNEEQHPGGSPAKKIYTITEAGKAELKRSLQFAPEPPEFKKTFLIQLAWSDQLNTNEFNAQLFGYEREIKQQILLQQEKRMRETNCPNRSPREIYIWEMIHENIISFYNNELMWVKKLRQGLCFCNEKVRAE